ncbi:methyl-accepting chemotaxis protein [Alishewanella sp. d11]|uniref:methyl-accepting chemotaxis protein n=1 Tax=Alishewanella sp. d11 TaxID=3414030 RepID=UPI003BF8B494
MQKNEKALERTNLNIALRSALDVCQANVMMADLDMNITYINHSLERMLKINEVDIRKQLPNFSVASLIGTNVDVFHKAPSHQRGIINQLQSPYNTKLKISGLIFDLIATPVFDENNVRLGTVVEWKDMTEELARRAEERIIHNENLRIRDALDNIETCVMIADAKNNIIFLNKSVMKMLSAAETEIRKNFPDFSARNLLHKNMDIFHKNPAHQKGMVEKLTSSFVTTIKIANSIFKLTASPINNDEGERIGTVVEWLDRTSEVAAEQDIERVVNAAAIGDFSERIDENSQVGFLKVIAKGLNALTSTSEIALQDINRVLAAIAQGDLTERVVKDYQGSFGELKDGCNQTAENLAQMLGEIREAVGTINTASNEISQGNTDLSSRTEQQASSLEETASSMEELTSTVRQNADNARQANTLAAKASDVAVEGGVLIEQVVKTMASINESAQKIADIIGVIDGIAFQTNILALNAAVEAARAGEQGRGFAVVASEVRTLAQRSANAAKDIKSLISDSVNKINNGNDLVGKSGNTMKEVVTSIKRVNDIMAEIAAASAEQSAGLDEVGKAVTQMDEMTQQNAALVEQAAAAAESLLSQAEQLARNVGRFTLDDEPVVKSNAIKSVTSSKKVAKSGLNKVSARPAAKLIIPAKSDEDEWESF